MCRVHQVKATVCWEISCHALNIFLKSVSVVPITEFHMQNIHCKMCIQSSTRTVWLHCLVCWSRSQTTAERMRRQQSLLRLCQWVAVVLVVAVRTSSIIPLPNSTGRNLLEYTNVEHLRGWSTQHYSYTFQHQSSFKYLAMSLRNTTHRR